MGEFTKRVQSNGIAGPLRRAFTPENWKQQFSDEQQPDDGDHDVYVTGLVIHQKLQTIRDVLKLSSATSISATTKLRAFVAVANYDFIVTRDKTEQAIAKYGQERKERREDEFSLEELTAVKLELPGGSKWFPREVVESLVDGIEIPVRVVLQEGPDLSGNPRMNQVEWNDVALELNLGIMYRFAEDIWDECLWNGYKMHGAERFKVFLPKDPDVIYGYRIGLARRLSLSMSFNIMATKFHREAVSRGLHPRIREVHGIERQGKRQVINVLKLGQSTRALEEILILRAHAAEPYYTELLDESQHGLQGLTLSALLDAWAVVSRASLVLVSSVGEKHARGLRDGSPPHAWFPKYVPVLQVNALVDALMTAAGIRPPDGRRLIEFLTFRGKPGQEIWAQPLVPVGPDTVAPVFAAVVTPNLRRLVDVWMRQAGVDLTRRGPAFEAYLRTMAAEAVARSEALSSHAACIKNDYTLKVAGGLNEQIDLLFVIGDTVFVAEAKCVLEPTDAKSVAMHRKAVLGAADQVLRKVAALGGNRRQFMSEAKQFGIVLTEQFRIFPLVVVSTTTHVGVPSKGVPVIDEFILGRFLNGELEDIAIQSSDLSTQNQLKTILYSDAVEAEKRAADYFAAPPQLQRFHDGVRERLVPIYAVDEQDWEGRLVTLECVPRGGLPVAQSIPVSETDGVGAI